MWEPDSRFGIRKQQQLLLTHRGVYKVYGGVRREIFSVAWSLQNLLIGRGHSAGTYTPNHDLGRGTAEGLLSPSQEGLIPFRLRSTISSSIQHLFSTTSMYRGR